MTQLLRDSLRDLAEDAQVAAPDPATWHRARRSRRRRVVGGLAAGAAGALVVVIAAVGMVVPTLQQGSDTAGQPTYDASQLALPTLISPPSPWETGTSDAGPIGPLAVLGESLGRHTSWFHTSDAYYGISAADGTYRYLDLPHINPSVSGSPALAPDGVHIAYWTAAPRSADPAGIDGYAVYDAVTGATVEHTLPNLADLRSRGLAWSPEGDNLVALYDGLSDPATRIVGAQILSLPDGAVRDLPLPALARAHGVDIAWGTGGIAFWRAPSLVIVDPQTGTSRRLDVDAQDARYSRDLAWSPDGSLLAVTATFRDPGGPFLQVNSLGVFPSSTHKALRAGVQRVSPFDAVYQLLGWRDGTHALVLGVPTEALAARADSVPGIYSIDVVSGSYERIAAVSLGDSAWIRGIAAGLATQPFADRPGPAGHPDPRAVWARVVALLFVVVMVVIVIRQTRRAKDPARSLGDVPA